MVFVNLTVSYTSHNWINHHLSECCEAVPPLVLMLWQWTTRLWGRQFVVWIPKEAREFSLLQNIPISSAAHPASQPAGTGIHSRSRNSDHSSPFGTKVKNECSYTSPPLYAFIVWTGTPLPFYYDTVLCLVVSTHQMIWPSHTSDK